MFGQIEIFGQKCDMANQCDGYKNNNYNDIQTKRVFFQYLLARSQMKINKWILGMTKHAHDTFISAIKICMSYWTQFSTYLLLYTKQKALDIYI